MQLANLARRAFDETGEGVPVRDEGGITPPWQVPWELVEETRDELRKHYGDEGGT